MNKPDRRGIVFVAAVLCLGALAAAGPDAPPPLIRRDLLRKEAPVFPKIVRDPFSTVVFIVDSGESGEPSDLTGKELSPAEIQAAVEDWRDQEVRLDRLAVILHELWKERAS